MPSKFTIVDGLQDRIPWDFSNREGLDVAFRFLLSGALLADLAAEVLAQGLMSWFPGLGTPTARPWIARARGLTRGPAELAAEFDARLVGWLDAHARKGNTRELIRQIQAYVPGKPRVRAITRSGVWTTLESNGTITVESAPWNWDGVLHPERSEYWSNLFVVIYTSAWKEQAAIGSPGLVAGLNEGVGLKIPKTQAQEIRSIIGEWKAARTRVRCVIFCPDPSLFDPTNPATCPDGTWGAWSAPSGFGYHPTSERVRSGRVTTCRYMEF